MDPIVAQAVLAAGKGISTRLTGHDGARIVRAWLGARGLQPDAWGNYVLPGGGLRYHFDAQTLKFQKKLYGEWHNRRSTPFIDFAQSLLVEAAEVLNEVDEQARWKGSSAKRSEEKGKRAEKAAFKELQKEASLKSHKRLADEYRDIIWNYLRNKGTITPEIQAAAERYRVLYVDRLKAGQDLPGDGLFASADRPPILPLYRSIDYDWTETIEDVEYSMLVRHQEPGLYATDQHRAAIQIGTGPETGMVIDPYTFRIGLEARPEAKGDGFLVGRVWDDGEMIGASVSVVYAVKDRLDAGGRLFSIWCSMMKGYGVRVWSMPNVIDKDIELLRTLSQQRKLLILKDQDSVVYLACGSERPELASSSS